MELLKQLREMTGAGMVDCKKALDEANGDLSAAVEILRKKGIAKSAKRADRETSEGVVAIARDIGNLPAEILFRLQDTVEIADSDQIATIFESFGIHNQRLAQHLTTMSNNFEWEYLQQLLKNRNEQKSI